MRYVVALALLGACAQADPTDLAADASALSPAEAAAACARAEDCDDGDPCTVDLCVVGNVCDHERMAGCVSPRRCARAADCDDGVACTRDRCLVSGLCDSVADDSMCAPGQRCVVGRGCAGGELDAGGGGGLDVAAPRDLGAAMDIATTPRDVAVAPDAGGGIDVVAAPDVPAVVDVSPPADAPPDPRSGAYAIAPAARYACREELFESEVVNLNVASMQVTLGASETVVTWPGSTITLRGAPIAGNTFRAAGTVPHEDCAAFLSLDATFADARRFAGTLSLRFAGFLCATSTCEAIALPVNGTRAP